MLLFMSLLLNQPSKLCIRKPALVRSSLSNGSSSSSTLLQTQTPPCCIRIDPRGYYRYPNGLEKKLHPLLVFSIGWVNIGASHGWVATLKKDGILRLQDDLNPVASATDPKRIPLPPLVTLPGCQTQIVTNVSMSSSSPEDEDCVMAVKFLGPQLSFCRPAQSNSEWINIRIENPCFFSSRVMFSEKEGMFRIPGSGDHLVGSWDHKHNSKLQKLRLWKFPKVCKTKRKLLHSCFTTEHLAESPSTGETFLLKWYKKTAEIINGIAQMKTKALMVFKLDEEGNAVYTQGIGDEFQSKIDDSVFPFKSFKNQIYIQAAIPQS